MDEFDFGKDSDPMSQDELNDMLNFDNCEIDGLKMAEYLFDTIHIARVKIIVHMLEATFGASDHDAPNAKNMKLGIDMLNEAAFQYNLQLAKVLKREQNDVG